MATPPRPLIATVEEVAKEEAAAAAAEASEARVEPGAAPTEVGVEVAAAA